MIGNIHNMAMTIQKKQTLAWRKTTGDTINEIGYAVTTYSPAVNIIGSFQPVPKSVYQQYGLDFQKSYFTFYTNNAIGDITRGVSGDQFDYKGCTYQCLSLNDWFDFGGWIGVLCVLV